MDYIEFKLTEEINVSCSEKKIDTLYLKQPNGLFLMDNPEVLDGLAQQKLSTFLPCLVDHTFAGKSEDKGLVKSDFANIPHGVQLNMCMKFAGFFTDGIAED